MAFLLLHGLGGDSRQPLSLVGPTLPEGARVFAPDLRAHGASQLIGGPEDFAFEAMAAELLSAICENGLADEPLTIIGISLGAALSLRLAQSGRLQLERLVLLRPAFTDAPIPPNLTVFPVVAELLHAHPPDQAEALFRRTGLYRSLQAASRLGAAGVIEQFERRRPRPAPSAWRSCPGTARSSPTIARSTTFRPPSLRRRETPCTRPLSPRCGTGSCLARH